jgi:hypothetical protein
LSLTYIHKKKRPYYDFFLTLKGKNNTLDNYAGVYFQLDTI